MQPNVFNFNCLMVESPSELHYVTERIVNEMFSLEIKEKEAGNP